MKNLKANTSENKLIQLINKAQSHNLVVRFDFTDNQLSVGQQSHMNVIGVYDKIFSTTLTDLQGAIIRTHEFVQGYSRSNHVF